MTSKKQNKKAMCAQNGCKRAVYKVEKCCILHCAKKAFAQADDQEYFSEKIIDYILEQLLKGSWRPSELLTFNGESREKSKTEFNSEYDKCNSNESKKSYLKKYIFESHPNQVKIKEITIDEIRFPKVIGHSSGHYSYVFSRFENVDFDKCFFYGKSWNILSCLVRFNGCTFLEKWTLTNYKTLDIIYQGCNFNRKVECKGKDTGTEDGALDDFLSFPQFDEKCTFDDGLKLENITIKANIFSVTSQPENSSNLSDFKAMKGLFEFTDCTFSTGQEIFLTKAEDASFSLKRCTFEKKFKIRNLEYGKGYRYQQEHKAALKSLTFNSCKVANDEHSYLRIGFLKNCVFSLKNLKNQQSSELNIGDCHFTSFELTNFRNLGKFKLFKINILEGEGGGKFKIDNTSIGNTDFQSLDLTSFSKVSMFDNIFSEIDYTNVQWPKTVHVEQFQKEDDGGIVKKRDTYRTLKNVALKNNDRPQALEFYAQEMDYHYQATKWSSQFGDKLTLFFNKVTNGFGTIWWLPLILLVNLSLLFSYLLVGSIGGILTPECYWTFLNPMHEIEFTGKGTWNGWTYFIDLLFRLIQALLIYQTIQGFRKFSRPL